MSDSAVVEILQRNQELLESIAQGDWSTYAGLCDPGITAFEPEAMGHLVHGLDFHKFYFQFSGGHHKPQNTITDPHVRIIGDVAVVAYFRLTQFVDGEGSPGTRGTEETRIWQRQNGQWKHIHFHRSPSKLA